jgi:hypothetical protein
MRKWRRSTGNSHRSPMTSWCRGSRSQRRLLEPLRLPEEPRQRSGRDGSIGVSPFESVWPLPWVPRLCSGRTLHCAVPVSAGIWARPRQSSQRGPGLQCQHGEHVLRARICWRFSSCCGVRHSRHEKCSRGWGTQRKRACGSANNEVLISSQRLRSFLTAYFRCRVRSFALVFPP